MPTGNNEIMNFLPCLKFFEGPEWPERILGLTFFYISKLEVKGLYYFKLMFFFSDWLQISLLILSELINFYPQ